MKEKALQAAKYLAAEVRYDWKHGHISIDTFNAAVAFEDAVNDPGSTIEVELTDEEFLSIAKMAHDQDVTFNDMVGIMLQEYIDGISYFNGTGNVEETEE